LIFFSAKSLGVLKNDIRWLNILVQNPRKKAFRRSGGVKLKNLAAWRHFATLPKSAPEVLGRVKSQREVVKRKISP